MWGILRNCEKVSSCINPYIKEILTKTNYYEENYRFACACSTREPVYSYEWDAEYREHFRLITEGANIDRAIIESLLDPKNLKHLPLGLKEDAERIDKREKEKLIKLIKKVIISVPPFVTRVSLYKKQDKNGTNYRGFIDLRPMPIGNVCEAFIKPPPWMKSPKYYITCERQYVPQYTLRPRALEVEVVDCVPYVGAMGDIGVCAQYSARLVLMTLSPKSPSVPELVFKSVRTYMSQERPQREGWNPIEIMQILENEGYTCFRYNRAICENCGKPIRTVKCSECNKKLLLNRTYMEPTLENIYAYVESGIPVLIGIEKAKYLPWWDDGDEKHALVAIGHTLSQDGELDGLIVHDVSKYPYQVLDEKPGGKPLEEIIVEAIAPVPREVTIQYQTARAQLQKLIQDGGISLDLSLDYRPVLVEANQIKRWLGEGSPREHFKSYKIPPKVQKDFSRCYLDRYIWLFELKRELGDGTRSYEGDILFSATRSALLGWNNPNTNEYAFRNNRFKIVKRRY